MKPAVSFRDRCSLRSGDSEFEGAKVNGLESMPGGNNVESCLRDFGLRGAAFSAFEFDV